MKNTRGRASLSAAVPAMGIALLLIVVACTAEAPVATDRQAAPESSPATNSAVTPDPTGNEVVAAIWVARDGTVEVDGVPYSVDQVSEVVAPLRTDGAVVSIEAHRAAPYRVVSAIEDELRAAKLLRVVFTNVEAAGERSSTRDVPALLDAGLAMVLPAVGMPEITERTVNPLNLLFLEVLPEGAVLVRRGASSSTERIDSQQVERVIRTSLAAKPSLITVLRTHPEAEYGYMYAVLDAIQRAEATRFALQLGG